MIYFTEKSLVDTIDCKLLINCFFDIDDASFIFFFFARIY